MDVVFWVLLAFLAAFGLFCFLWALLGFFLPRCRKGWLLCPGTASGLEFVPVFLWLRGIGLVNCPLKVLDLGISETQRDWLIYKDIEVVSPEGLDFGKDIL